MKWRKGSGMQAVHHGWGCDSFFAVEVGGASSLGEEGVTEGIEK